mmetsp:Transcript_17448/g.36058  ORF Transcript_17448/g.36058 Transcript_17448/m.36058 type:complete len:988 (-) Transcript_17448:13-2976(-)
MPRVDQLSKYSVIKTLGQGSFGKALLVKIKGAKPQYFVMKEIQIGHLSKKEKATSIAEATVLASMHHSNICSYVESFLNAPKNNILYIVMDYADGGDLSGAISRRKKARRPFTENEVMNMFVQICLALKHVHSRKILHRDLKSQNIFLTKKGVVKLGDFGIAKVLDNTGDVARTQIGTPYYLSPEICEDKPYGKKSDVWSLGCVLYEIAALDLPFQARNLPALAHRIMTKEPKPLPSTFSSQLRLLATSLLNKKPAIRPSVVAILRSDYVQGHISSLLSHTIKSGTGGMEGDAKPSSANKGGAAGAAAANLPPSNFNPKLPPSKIKQQADEYRREMNQQQQHQQHRQQRNKSALGNEQNAIRARAAEQYRRNQNHAAAEKANKERIRMEKMEEFRAEQQKKQEALERYAIEEAKLAMARQQKAKEREREAMKKLKKDMIERKRRESMEMAEVAERNDDGFDDRKPPAIVRESRKPSVLRDWVDLSGGAGDGNDSVYEGRDGWMLKEQDKLESEIEEAKMEYEEQQRRIIRAQEQDERRMGGDGQSAWEAKRAAAVRDMKLQQMKDNSAYQLRRQRELSSIHQQHQQISVAPAGSPAFGGGRFANPTQEWEWRRQQAEKNRIRASYDLGGGRDGASAAKGDEVTEFRNRMNKMNSKISREETARREAAENLRRQDEARAVFFQNRQIAAAAKARYEVEEMQSPSFERGRKGSSVAEVRRSAEMQRQVEEAKKKQAFDDAYKEIANEKRALAEKLRARMEEGKREEGKLRDEEVNGDTIATQIEVEQEGEQADEVESVQGEEDVEGLAQALAEVEGGGLGDEDEDEDEEEEEEMIVRGGNTGKLMASIHTAIECGEEEEEEEVGYGDDDDIEEEIVFRGENTIPMGNVDMGNMDANSVNVEEVKEMEELVRSLKMERLSRENSKNMDSEDEEDGKEEDLVVGGGGMRAMMPKGTYSEEPSPPSSPSNDKSFSASNVRKSVSSPPPPPPP